MNKKNNINIPYGWRIFLLLFLLLAPPSVNWIMGVRPLCGITVNGEISDWISFLSGYIGAITASVGILISLHILNITLKENHNNNREQKEFQLQILNAQRAEERYNELEKLTAEIVDVFTMRRFYSVVEKLRIDNYENYVLELIMFEDQIKVLIIRFETYFIDDFPEKFGQRETFHNNMNQFSEKLITHLNTIIPNIKIACENHTQVVEKLRTATLEEALPYYKYSQSFAEIISRFKKTFFEFVEQHRDITSTMASARKMLLQEERSRIENEHNILPKTSTK